MFMVYKHNQTKKWVVRLQLRIYRDDATYITEGIKINLVNHLPRWQSRRVEHWWWDELKLARTGAREAGAEGQRGKVINYQGKGLLTEAEPWLLREATQLRCTQSQNQGQERQWKYQISHFLLISNPCLYHSLVEPAKTQARYNSVLLFNGEVFPQAHALRS